MLHYDGTTGCVAICSEAERLKQQIREAHWKKES